MAAFIADDSYTIEDVFPEVIWNGPGVCLRGARAREDMTQKELSEKTGIPQRHISEMRSPLGESGKRSIGKMLAHKLGETLKIGYRVFL